MASVNSNDIRTIPNNEAHSRIIRSLPVTPLQAEICFLQIISKNIHAKEIRSAVNKTGGKS